MKKLVLATPLVLAIFATVLAFAPSSFAHGKVSGGHVVSTYVVPVHRTKSGKLPVAIVRVNECGTLNKNGRPFCWHYDRYFFSASSYRAYLHPGSKSGANHTATIFRGVTVHATAKSGTTVVSMRGVPPRNAVILAYVVRRSDGVVVVYRP